jgi:DNA polymerase I-like protein with 3'-5' exonuclease and polymerase domains
MSIDIASKLLDDFTESSVKELIELRPWMKTKKFILLKKQTDIEAFIDLCIKKGICSYDFETTGLNTRLDSEGKPVIRIVGICMAHDPDEGVYIPISHEDAQEYNVSLSFMLRETARLVASCVLVFHNFKYDGQILRNHGIFIDREEMYEDTFLMAAVEDASRREKGLKYLSGALLNRPQLEIDDMGVKGRKKSVVAFEMIPPQKAVYYGGGDGMNTLALYFYLKEKIDQQDPTGRDGPWAIYKIEKRCLFVTMEMERNYVRIDKRYLEEVNIEVERRMQKLLKEIYTIVGHEFDINSAQQLGVILFDELKLPYPKKAERTKAGGYQTNGEVLEMVETKNPLMNMVLTYRGYVKVQSTYLHNWLINADENDEVKFKLNQVQADTGRFSGSGGYGVKIDGYCGVNCQNVPTYNKEDPHSINLRKAMIAHPGYKMLSIDYSGEELRVAANVSKEPKWLHEFLHGTGDLHTITGKIITGKSEITKRERGIGKTLNFLTLYGGGAGGFAAQAKIPYETAKKMIINFFKEYKGLSSWIQREWKAAKKRGYSKTAFGRRRSLGEFYNSPDKGIQAKGDRCAINSAVQGCLVKEERCLTDKYGYISIGTIKEFKDKGEHLKIWTGTTWASFDVLNRGKCQLATIELSNGMLLRCDTRHEVLVVGEKGYEFRHFKDLDENTDICVSIPLAKEFGSYPPRYEYKASVHNGKSFVIDSKEQWDFIAYLMGYVVGDDIRTNPRLSLKLNLEDERLKKYLPEINSKGLVDLFIELGYQPADSRPKRIPEMIFRSPISMRTAFIKGYFDTDDCNSFPYASGGVSELILDHHISISFPYASGGVSVALLRDTQLIGWSIGLPSIVRKVSEDTYKLEWQDLKKVEEVLGLPSTEWKRRSTINKMILPEFLRKEFQNKLYSVYDRKNVNDCAYFCKLNTGKKVTLPGMLLMMKKYGCELPSEIYYHYKLKKKTIIDKTEDTFTLSVHSDLHRFDSAGIISKNTGADVIKIALWRVYKWICENNLQEDIKILLPIHDEILFEVKEDKLDFVIPELCRIMKLRDLTDKLKWEVPFDVDAEYGDTFDVDHNYWEEYKEKIKKEGTGNFEVAHKTEPVVETSSDPATSDPAIVEPVSTTLSSADNYYKDITVKSMLVDGVDIKSDAHAVLNKTASNIADTLFKDAKIMDRIDAEGYFNYPMDIDPVSARQLRHILEIIRTGGDNLFIGPKQKLCILSRDGEIFYKSTDNISIDAFLILCIMYRI